MISSIFFDLDGTLADTAPDLAAALNQLLQEQNRSVLPLDTIRPAISLGANVMIKLAFAIEEDDPDFTDLRRRFLEIYHERLHQDTHVFPGIEDVLEYIESKDMIWGVVTNKSEWLTRPVMEQLKLTQRAACIVSGPNPVAATSANSDCQSDWEKSVCVCRVHKVLSAGDFKKMKLVFGLFLENICAAIIRFAPAANPRYAG